LLLLFLPSLWLAAAPALLVLGSLLLESPPLLLGDVLLPDLHLLRISSHSLLSSKVLSASHKLNPIRLLVKAALPAPTLIFGVSDFDFCRERMKNT
jgi:hypothetical protein